MTSSRSISTKNHYRTLQKCVNGLTIQRHSPCARFIQRIDPTFFPNSFLYLRLTCSPCYRLSDWNGARSASSALNALKVNETEHRQINSPRKWMTMNLRPVTDEKRTALRQSITQLIHMYRHPPEWRYTYRDIYIGGNQSLDSSIKG